MLSDNNEIRYSENSYKFLETMCFESLRLELLETSVSKSMENGYF